MVFSYNGKNYGAREILRALRALGIKHGDTLFVHSDLKSFGKIAASVTRDEFLEAFLAALKKSVGVRGNIIMPTFSYSYTKKEVYDPLRTPSTVGLLTEYFRTRKGVARSLDPIFSVAALGPLKKYYIAVGTDCFGQGSVFEKIFANNAKILFLGDNFSITFIHFVEQTYDVNYRFIKKFKGKTRIGNKLKSFEYKYFVRPLNGNVKYDLENVAGKLKKYGIVKKVPLGHSQIRLVEAKDAFEMIARGIKKNSYFLLKGKPR